MYLMNFLKYWCHVWLTWFEVQCSEGFWVQEIKGGTNSEENVIIVPLVQDYENQVAHLKTTKEGVFKWGGGLKRQLKSLTLTSKNTYSRMAIFSECRDETDDILCDICKTNC